MKNLDLNAKILETGILNEKFKNEK